MTEAFKEEPEKKRRKLYEQGEAEHPLTHLKLLICWR